MSKIILMVVIAGLVIAGVERWSKASLGVPPAPVVTPKESGREYAVEGLTVSGQSQVRLVNNLDERLGTAQIMEKNGCLAGVNGGFYDEAGRALGLLVVDGKRISRSKTSSLLNGFVWQVADGKIFMGQKEPETEVVWAMQAGPVLIEKGTTLRLALVKDKPARRMVMGVRETGEQVMMTVFVRESVFDGPLLTDLPEIVAEAAKKKGWEVVTAVNLDGGTASAFYADEVKLEEFLAVGSFLCVLPAD